MNKNISNTFIFSVVVFSSIISSRYFLPQENKNQNYKKDERIYLKKDEIAYEDILPMFQKAKVLRDEFRYEETIDVFKEILKKIPQLNIDDDQKEMTTSRTLSLIGEYYEELGSYDKAIFYLQESVKKDVISLDPFEKKAQIIIPNYQKLAGLHIKAEAYDLAIDTLFMTLELIENNYQGDSYAKYEIISQLGDINVLLGKYGEAEYFYQYSIANIKKFVKNHPFIENIELKLAEVYINQARFEEANYLLTKHANSSYKNEDTILRIAELLKQTKQYKNAEKLILSVLESNKEFLANNKIESVNFINFRFKLFLADLYDKQNLFAKAQTYYADILDNHISGLKVKYISKAKFFNSIGFNTMARGDFSTAEEFLKTSLEIYNLNPQKSSSITETYSNLALLYSLNGNPKEAIFYYEKSIRDTLFFIKNESPYLLLSERQRFLESKASEYFLPFAFSNKNSDFKEIALLSRLNYKGLLQDLEKNQAKLDLSNTDNQNLKNKINFLTKQISSLRDNPEITKNLITEKRAYEKILNSQMPKLNNSIVEVIDVSNSLPENGVLVEFQKYDINRKNPFKKEEINEHYLALILKEDGSTDIYDLGSSLLIDNKIKEALFYTKQGDDKALKVWDELSQLIIKPLDKSINGSKKLFISPDSELNRIPFATIKSANGEDFLNQNFDVHILTTGRELIDINKKSDKSNYSALVIANPDFNMKSQSINKTKDSYQNIYKKLKRNKSNKIIWDPIPETLNEGEAIKKLTNGTLISGENATQVAIEDKKFNPKIIHIASHAYYDIKINPIFENSLQNSGIVLAGANFYNKDSFDDGYLTAYEISRLDWNGVELVVISGCQSADGNPLFGEGLYGLKRAITVAGARASLLTLWEVDDEATSVFMQTFYKFLSTGLSKTKALNLTQSQFRDGKIKSKDPDNNDWRKPYYWAGFQLSGDWKPIKM